MISRVGKFWSALGLMLVTFAPTTGSAQPTFHNVFGDHAVLQHGRPIRLWGKAGPLEKITVRLGDHSVQSIADAEGNWQAQLPAMVAGGPYVLSVTNPNGAATVLQDILVGDVFLCAGQSNMEMPVNVAMNSRHEIASASHPNIRLFDVQRSSAPRPQTQFAAAGSWKTATSNNVGDFSAVCYFFARELQPHIDVPIGLISATWGGSSIDAWSSTEAMVAAGRGADVKLLELYAQNKMSAQIEFGKIWERYWTRAFPDAGRPWKDKTEAGWKPVPKQMGNWKAWGQPGLDRFNGAIWFRKSFMLTAEQAKQDSVLHLGSIDEMDMVWVNGIPVGQTFGWGEARQYALPKGTLRAGRNDIVVNIFSEWDAGGMYGPPGSIRLVLSDGTEEPLGDGWSYQIGADSALSPPRAPWLSIVGTTVIANAMMKPLGAYGLRGALWYQGETDAGRAGAYSGLLASLMSDWRKQFGNPELPVLVVQLPNFGIPVTSPMQSDWSALREAQRRAVLADQKAGLAITIDAGEEIDVHPPNKQIVGQRLARLARHLIYRQTVTANGPVIKSVERAKDIVRLTFGGIDGRLVARSSNAPISFEICGTLPGSCAFVDARIDENTVILNAPDGMSAERIRYCWGDAPLCNLYDTSGLPAGPFEVAIP